MATREFKDALSKFSKIAKPFFGSGVPSTYRSNVTAIQKELDSCNGPQILEDWILPQIKKKCANSVFELLDDVTKKFDNELILKSKSMIGSYDKPSCRSALIAFTKFILGQYKGALYMQNDEESCRQVARNALFCTVKVAEKVRDGDAGSGLNKKHKGGKKGKGNRYYSWYCYKYQRKTTGQEEEIGTLIKMSPQLDPENMGEYILDSNVLAAYSIKYAVIEGLPQWLKATYRDFVDYMACHIWGKSCYDYRYHTSLFNLVLLPTSLGGLSDYCPAVKEMLQYEAAMRFGVYPDGYDYVMSPETQKIYKKLDDDWRQPEEHKIALANIKAGMKPTALK